MSGSEAFRAAYALLSVYGRGNCVLVASSGLLSFLCYRLMVTAHCCGFAWVQRRRKATCMVQHDTKSFHHIIISLGGCLTAPSSLYLTLDFSLQTIVG